MKKKSSTITHAFLFLFFRYKYMFIWTELNSFTIVTQIIATLLPLTKALKFKPKYK